MEKQTFTNTITVNDENFDNVVLQSDIRVLVDFWGEWCEPVRTLFIRVLHFKLATVNIRFGLSGGIFLRHRRGRPFAPDPVNTGVGIGCCARRYS